MFLSASSLAQAFVSYLTFFPRDPGSASGPHRSRHTDPIVTLDDATFIGSSDGRTNKFFGIPYAQPPTGKLRFSHPVATAAYTGTHNASTFGPVCPQQHLPTPESPPAELDLQLASEIMSIMHNTSAPESEDCLSLNVWTPSDVQQGSKLPIVVYIHGGAYQIGSGAFANGQVIVERSIQIGEPIIFVSINYRLSALGWLTGKEAEAASAGNLGFRDQRLAMQWVQKYISSFGGDPSKVVLWGQSAGAMSVVAHMVTSNGNPSGLFHGAYLQSGTFVLLSSMQESQRYYDNLVADAGCKGAVPNTLECLREAPLEQLRKAMDASPIFTGYTSLSVAWGSRTDGDFLVSSPRELASRGVFANIPIVVGTCDDEGTLFALPSLNLSTTDDMRTYLSTFFFHNATQHALDVLLNTHYPEDPVLGSPFETGKLNAVTPQFKRLSAILGDYLFESQKRALLEAVDGKQDVWTYISKRRKDTSVLGSAHSMDARFDLFGPSDMTDHLIRFSNHLNPNGIRTSHSSEPRFSSNLHTNNTEQTATLHTHVYNDAQVPLQRDDHHIVWPKFDSKSKATLTYLDGDEAGTKTTRVVYGFEREESVRYLQELSKVAWIP